MKTRTLLQVALTLTLIGSPAALAKPPAEKEKAPAAAVSSGNQLKARPSSWIQTEAQKIDKLIEAGYAKNKITPNALIDDATFCRRVHLDLGGRIPTFDEINGFLSDKSPDKRVKLIDKLLTSEAYTSHFYNFWADVLRLQSRMQAVSGQPYIDFVKNSLRTNKPYDKFVYELLSSSGSPYDQPATGYYLRDDGMALDNMASTVRIFLGTRLECAQCHDHPFDKWTQHEFYELAAYTYGMNTRARSEEDRARLKELTELSKDNSLSPQVKQQIRNLVRPLNYAVNDDSRRKLTLPKDYKYDDAKPGTVIQPHSLFGDPAQVKNDETPRDVYAKWMTDSKNPRFTTVIANRLWKKVFGVGVIEPVDDLRDETEASNPALMSHLESLMRTCNYDMKQYLRVLFNTRTYQRQVSSQEAVAGEPYHFPGPILRRMSAEQLWDSMIALAMPESDHRPSTSPNGRYNNFEQIEMIRNATPAQIVAMAKMTIDRKKGGSDLLASYRDLKEEMQKAMAKGDTRKAAELRGKLEDIRKDNPAAGAMMQNREKGDTKTEDPRWKTFPRDMVRASELPSPARPGHFLEQFGQSDREVIDGSNTDATVTQTLTLLNGPAYSQLSNTYSLLRKNIEAARTPQEQIRVLFLSILGREPKSHETAMIARQLQEEPKDGIGNAVWSLINTRQFAFIQ